MNRQSNNFYLDEKERNEKRKCFNSPRFYVVHFDEDANDALYRLRLSTVSFE